MTSKLLILQLLRSILVASAILASSANADPWTSTDASILAWAFVALAADYKQTSQIDDSPYHYERNPLLGRDPSQADINRHFALSFATIGAISAMAPREFSRPMLIMFGFFDSIVVAHNIKMGLQVRF